MKHILLSLAFAASFVASPVHAEGAIIGKVVEVRIDFDGKGLVTFADTIVGTQPACAIAGYNHSMSFDAATAGGKAMYAMALLAKSSDATVYGMGKGTCVTYGVVEDASILFLK
ncbi:MULTISPECIES: hypothetical protein [unclassified Janthinobacterium]|uniref:hypothetical protein n=1 Tax=unclassified Janthinobacterium TaxID=2610881 RepID=UPI00160C2F5A|nr:MULTISPECIES: hypothetical protein [unclassified Janthinobacterium]MBB5368383.1 hypothetical protein [Janthinobacterium sp. K2C7]MBB5382081.1 hypothetical protein [Janthinobacterium sp. K2Li3]MBB5386765.1 hypothetical protein [Janthinobacterium sp. K2E3]